MSDPDDYWQNEARCILRAQIARSGMNYKELALALEKVGVDETAKALSNKVGRGTFSFAFFLQCMHALGMPDVKLTGVMAAVANRAPGGAETHDGKPD